MNAYHTTRLKLQKKNMKTELKRAGKLDGLAKVSLTYVSILVFVERSPEVNLKSDLYNVYYK